MQTRQKSESETHALERFGGGCRGEQEKAVDELRKAAKNV